MFDNYHIEFCGVIFLKLSPKSAAIQQTQPKRIVQPKIIYEEYNDWQDYDPNVVDSTNGYGESSSNGHYYQSSSSNDIYTDDGIITEEYITSEGDLGKLTEDVFPPRMVICFHFNVLIDYLLHFFYRQCY